MKLIFLGPPGAGKGTYATYAAKEYGIVHVSTGDLLRAEVKKETELGKEIGEIIQKGNLVPDRMITDLLKKRFEEPDCKKGYILDGFPRNIPQVHILKDDNIEFEHVINFTATKETIIKRLSGRRTCKKCGAIYHIINIPPKKEGVCDKCGGELYQREDQKEEVVKHRLEVYEEQTKPLIEHFRKEGSLIDIDADKKAEEVWEELKKLLDQLYK